MRLKFIVTEDLDKKPFGAKEPEYSSPQGYSIFKNFLRRLLPWVAMILTRLRYTNKRSRFIDRLIVLSEG